MRPSFHFTTIEDTVMFGGTRLLYSLAMAEPDSPWRWPGGRPDLLHSPQARDEDEDEEVEDEDEEDAGDGNV